MPKSDKLFLTLFIIGVIGSIWMWAFNYDEQTKSFVRLLATGVVISYLIFSEFSFVKRQNDIIIDLLWEVSYQKMSDEEKESMRERITKLNKDRR